MSSSDPQSNRYVEEINKVIKDLLKKMLGSKKRGWIDELFKILWVYCTTFKTTTGETPYFLTFSTKGVILLEVGMPTFKTFYFDKVSDVLWLDAALNLSEEKMDQAQVKMLHIK